MCCAVLTLTSPRRVPDHNLCWQHGDTGEKGLSFFFFRFELLEVLSFDSVRRRMSVIVKSATGSCLFGPCAVPGHGGCFV